MPVEPTSTGTVLALIGEFDIAQLGLLKEAFGAVAGAHTVVVDLSQTTYIDSSVLSLLIGQRDEMLIHGGGLVIVGASKMVKRIFDLTSLSKVFDFRPSVDAVIGATEFRRVEIVADGTPQPLR